MEYGLTSNGFITKPMAVLLEEERTAYRQAFGDDIDISDDSVAGKYIANQVAKFTELWELLDGLWSVGDVDSAKGIYLDRLAALVNVQRVPAIQTQVAVCIWGDEGESIRARIQARLSSTRDLFYLRDAVIISRNNLLGFWIRVSAVTPGEMYTFQIMGVTISYTAIEGDDEESIQQAFSNAINNNLPGLFTVEDSGGDGLRIRVTDGITPFAFNMADDKLEVVLLGAFSVFLAQAPGSIFAPIGTLTELVSNISVDSIINYATGLTGRGMESDTELRINLETRQKQASSNEIAIQSKLQEVSGVSFARVYSNRTMSVVNGRPPKSYESVVIGGDDMVIAQTIFNNGPAGIEPFGNTIVEITDSEGFPWDIGFSRPNNKYIWIKIGIEKNLEEEYPINGNDLIRDNIVKWANANIGVGVDLIFQRLLKPVYQVPGVGYADIRVAQTVNLDPPTASEYLSANIVIGEVDIAVFDRSRILVEEIS